MALREYIETQRTNPTQAQPETSGNGSLRNYIELQRETNVQEPKAPSVASQIPNVLLETAKQLSLRAVKSYPEFAKGLGDTTALIGDKMGLQGVSNYGRNVNDFWDGVSDKIPQDPKYSGLQGLSGGWQTAIPTIAGETGGQITNLIMALGGGAGGATLAKVGGLGKVGTAISTIAGTSIPNIAQEGNYLDKIQQFQQMNGLVSSQDMRNIQNTALSEKAINTVLETLADRLLFGKLFPTAPVPQGLKGKVAKVLKDTGEQAITEGLTEGVQESVSIGAEKLLGINDSKNNLHRLAEASAIGGITGGVIGGTTSAVSQPYNTNFKENTNTINPAEAIKEVSAKIMSGGKEIYNSANNALNQPTAFDNLRLLQKEYASQPSVQQTIEKLAPNVAKKQTEIKNKAKAYNPNDTVVNKQTGDEITVRNQVSGLDENGTGKDYIHGVNTKTGEVEVLGVDEVERKISDTKAIETLNNGDFDVQKTNMPDLLTPEKGKAYQISDGENTSLIDKNSLVKKAEKQAEINKNTVDNQAVLEKPQAEPSITDGIAKDYATQLNQDEVRDFHRNFADAIINKKADTIIELVARAKGQNDISKKVFQKYTGVNLPNTIKGKQDAILNWAGKNPDAWRAEKQTAQQKKQVDYQEKQKQELIDKINQDFQTKKVKKDGQIMTFKEMFDGLKNDGYELSKYKRGIKPVYKLKNSDGTFYEFTSPYEKKYIDHIWGDKNTLNKEKEADYGKTGQNVISEPKHNTDGKSEVVRGYVEANGEKAQLDNGAISDTVGVRPEKSELLREHRDLINKAYRNQHELNTEIENFIKNGEHKKYSEIPQEVKDWVKKYAGAGGLERQGAEGKGLLSEYYTPDNIVKKMWDLTAQYIDTDGSKVLEPSVGIGRFIEHAPNGAKIDAVEMNPISAEISKILYPEANISVGEFQSRFVDPKTNTPLKKVNGEYDIVIGNPPYGKYSGRYKGLGEGKGINKLETYFIKRGLDSLKDNGVMTFIVPSSFLDGAMTPAKLEISKNAKILDAYRLPENTFDTTSIGTDVIVLRKTRNIDEKSLFNNGEWFNQNPEKTLGEKLSRRNRFGKDETYIKGDKNSIETIDTSKKDVQKTQLLGNPEQLPKNTQKPVVNKPLTTEKTIKGNVQYEAYIPEQTVSDEEYKIYADTQVDGTLPHSQYTPNEKISQYEGKLYNDFNYLQGDIYDKLDQLERENLSEAQKEIQHKKLMSVLPKPKELEDIKFTPTSDFVADISFGKTEEKYYDYSTYSHKYKDVEDTLFGRFKQYVNDTTSSERNYVNSWDLRNYIEGDRLNIRTYGSDPEVKKQQRVEQLTKIKNTADKLFNDFVNTHLSDTEKSQLKDIWNRKYNAIYNPDFNKVPLMVKDMNSKFYGKPLKLLDVQKEGINFLTNTGVGLLGFEVGVGKTLAGIASTVQNMQMGRTKKPLVLVPKQVKANWIREINQLFPNMKVNDLDNLSKFKGKIDDGTLSIATYEALSNLWYDENMIQHSDGSTSRTGKINELIDKIYDIAIDKGKESTKRGLENLREDVNKLVGIAEKGNKKLHNIDELGFDHITIDEAHNFRNLFRSAKAYGRENNAYQAIGQSGDPSSRASRLFLLSQYILDKNENRNVFMLTATPFNNSPLEVFNMLSFIGKDKLDRMGLYNVYQFMENYADLEADWVVKNNNDVDYSQVVKGFKNATSLRELIKSLMLVRSADEAGVKRPTKHVDRVTLEPNQDQLNLIAQFEEEAITSKDDGAILKKINQARQVTLSPDIAVKNTSVTPEELIKNSPKLSYIAEAIKTMRKKEPNTSQLLYMPLGVEYLPKLKQYFIEKGTFKADEIEIISSNTKDEKIPAITDSFNATDGKVKLIIGTQRIREGMNLNKNTSILYVPFMDWNPTDFVQITGRIWRQGNKYNDIRVVVPLLKNSSDPFMFQKLDEKTSRINNIMDESREYIETGELNTAEEKLNMITLPDKKAKMFVNVERQKLNNKKIELKGRLETVDYYAKKLESEKESIENYKNKIVELQTRIEKSTDDYTIDRTKDSLSETKKDLKKSENKLKSVEATIKRLEIDFKGKDDAKVIEEKIKEISAREEKLKEVQAEKLKEYEVEYSKNQLNKKTIDDHVAEFKSNIDKIYSDSVSEDSLPAQTAPKKKYEKTYESSYNVPRINLETKTKALTQNTRKEKLRAIREIKDAKQYDKVLREGVRNWKSEIETRRYDVDKSLVEFINSTRKIAKDLGVNDKTLREIMPFLRERTELPNELDRADLKELWNKLDYTTKDNLKDMADALSSKFERYWQEYKAVQADESLSPNKSEIENYITHIWEFDNKAQKSMLSNYFATKSRFAKKRTIETLFDGIEGIELENGEIMKLKPKVLDYAEILKIQSDNLIKATVDKVFADQVKNFKTADGLNLVLPANKAPSNWVEINNSALNKNVAKPIKSEFGEVVSPEMQNILSDMGVAIGKRLSQFKRNGELNSLGKFIKNQPPEIRLQRWFSNKTLAHEIGHAIDNALGLQQDGFVNRHKDSLMELSKARIDEFDKQGKKHYATKDSELIAELTGVLFNDTKLAYDKAPQATSEIIERISKNEKISKLLPENFEWDNAKHVLEEKTVEFFKMPVKVHPDIASTLKLTFENPKEYVDFKGFKPGKFLDKANAVAKMFEFSLSAFHGYALTESFAGNVGAKKGLGEALNFKKVFNSVKNNDYDIYKNDSLARQAIEDGLQIGATIDVQRGTVEKIVDDVGKTLESKIPMLGKPFSMAIHGVGKALEVNNKVLWDVIHNNYKLSAYKCLLEAETKGGDVSTAIRREIAHWTNDSFGGQVWENLSINSSTKHLGSRMLMSPDWLVSCTRQFMGMFSSETGHKTLNNLAKKNEFWQTAKEIGQMAGINSLTDDVTASGVRGRVARKFWLRAFIQSAIYMNVLNAIFRMRDRDDNPELYPENMGAKDYSMLGNSGGSKTCVFVGRNKDGTERYVRFGKQFREVPELLEDPLKKMGGKIAPLPQWAVQSFTGRTLSGYENRELSKAKGWGKAGQSVLQLGKMYLPFSVGSLLNKGGDYSIFDLVATTNKGMTFYKGKEEYKKAIKHKDKAKFQEITKDLQRNKVDPNKVVKSTMGDIRKEAYSQFMKKAKEKKR